MRLNALDLAAGAETLLYTVPADCRAVITVNLANRAPTLPKVRLAVTGAAAPTVADWLNYDAVLAPAGVAEGGFLERTGIVLGAGQRVYVRSDLAGVSAVAMGVVEPVA